jgi:hypothetical protein
MALFVAREMKRTWTLAMLFLALGGCMAIPQAPAVSDSAGGLFCEAKATAGCAGCQAACSGDRRAVCFPGTDGLVLQDGAAPFCYRKSECFCR